MSEFKWKKHQSLLGIKVEKEKSERHPTVDGLRLRVFPSGKKSWQWARKVEGVQLRKSLGRFPAITMSEAQCLANALNEKVAQGLDPFEEEAPVPVPAGPARITVADGWDRYIADCKRRGRKATYKQDLAGKKDIVGVIGTMFLRDVGSADIDRVIAAPIQRKGGCTGGQVRSNAILRQTKTFLTHCLKKGYDELARNVASGIGPIENIQGRRKKRSLSMREMALVILAARELDRRNNSKSTWADIISILVLNGNRKSEVMECRGEEWDAKRRLWIIGGARYKTTVDCKLPTGPTTAAIFDRRAVPGKFLIPAQSGVRTGQDLHICTRLRAIMEEIGGEPVERWTMHHLRYGFRGNIRAQRIANSELAERIIHPKAQDDDVEYDIEWLDDMREALTKWDARLNEEILSILSTEPAVAD